MTSVSSQPVHGSIFADKALVIASHNAGKVTEIDELIAPLGIKVISATDANIVEPEETGDTFEANAILKAEHAAQSANLPSLADDSGLVIPAIGGAPGIYSARWAGPDKNFASAFKRIQDELGDKPAAAHFVCVLALCLPGSKTHLFRGRIDGTLTFPPRGGKGFGYDPIFIPDGYDITFAEIDPLVKNHISHRARAFEKFLHFLNKQPGNFMKLLAFAASHRLDSYNRKLIKLAIAHLSSQNIDVDFAEYGDFDMPIYNDAFADKSDLPKHTKRFAERAANVDGIIISSPEYNWSYPGSLKNIIDWTSCIKPNPLAGKTVLLMSASPGSRGGIIGLQHLKSPLEAIDLTVFSKVFPLGHCREAFDGNGNLIDIKHSQNLLSILNNYVTFTHKLTNN